MLDQAERSDPDGSTSTVILPERVWLAAQEQAPVQRGYRRRSGDNVIKVQASGPRWISISENQVGPLSELTIRHHERALGLVVGPRVVAAVVGTLGLCMLLLWWRGRQSLHGYLGAGVLGWSLHTAWPVLPWSPVTGMHQVIWWTSLYAFFVAMLVIFCLRIAAWNWPRFERALWAATLAAPALLYAAAAHGHLDPATDIWHVVWIAVSGVGAVAVAHAFHSRPDLDRLLIGLSGLAFFGFGVHDWWVNSPYGANNPVHLAPYAGLLFVVAAVHMLVDRHARATRQLEKVHIEREDHVDRKNAELRDTVDKLRQARDFAEAANLAKTRFLAAASHDLRQPAHALALYMAALRAEPLDARQADLVTRMSGSLAALGKMFNLLLDMSRIDAGALKPQACRFEIYPLLRRLADEFAPQAEAKDLRLALRLPPTPTLAIVLSDPVLVERIVRNLLSNAVKYTRQGGVLLACRLRRHGHKPGGGARGAGRHWHIEVWDTGIGIAPVHRERIFEEFFQVGNPGRNREHGLGLGLSIVNRLAQLLGLGLAVQSNPGRGSRFSLQLPQPDPALLEAAAAPEPPSSSPELPPALHGMVVAMLEDDAEVRHAMRALLTCWGCRVIEGADAAELSQHWDENAPPSAIVADHRLRDGRTGPDEVRALFKRWKTGVPVLIMTGEVDIAQLQDVMAVAYPCLVKPVAPSRLLGWLEEVGRTGQQGNPAAASIAGDVP